MVDTSNLKRLNRSYRALSRWKQVGIWLWVIVGIISLTWATLVTRATARHQNTLLLAQAVIFYSVASPWAHPAAARILIEHGADVNASKPGFTPLTSSMYGDDPTNFWLLLAHGADPKPCTADGTNALMIAAALGKSKMVRELLHRNIDINLADKYGLTALMHAATEGDTTTISLLLAAGADTTLMDDENRTAEEIAIDWQNRPAAQLIHKSLPH